MKPFIFIPCLFAVSMPLEVASAATGDGGQAAGQMYSQASVGNKPSFTVVPSISETYDSNALRYSNSTSLPKDNFRTTLGLDLLLNKLLGVTQVEVSSSFGYDFNSRFKFLNQPRLSAAASAAMPVLGVCNVTGGASYRQFQFDQADLIQRVRANSKEKAGSLQFACSKIHGISPVAGVQRQELENSRFSFLNFNSTTYTGGLSYTQPSVGVVSILADYTELTRPGISDILGIDDSTRVYNLSAQVSRSLAPRLRYSIRAGYANARPNRPQVPQFKGLTYDGTITYSFSSLTELTAAATRALTNENGFSATYVKKDVYQLSLRRLINYRSSATLSGRLINRSFRGEGILLADQEVNKDRNYQVGMDYSLDFLSKLRFGARVARSWRRSPEQRFNYKSNIVRISIGARF